MHTPLSFRLDVGDGDGARASRDGSEGFAALLNVDDLGTTWASTTCASASKGDCTKVGEWNEAAALFVILNDPLGVRLTERGRRGNRLADGLALCDVLDYGRAGLRGGGSHRQFDLIARREADAREVVGLKKVLR